MKKKSLIIELICVNLKLLKVNYINNLFLDKFKYDFYLPDYNCCIDFVDNREKISNKLISIEANKTKYCKENNITLIRIPYLFYKKINRILEIEHKNDFNKSIDFRKCILIVAGTRPEKIKTSNLYLELEKKSIPVLYSYSGQHANNNMMSLDLFDIIFDIKNNDNIGRINNIISENIVNFGKLFHENSYIKYVMVQGDTGSAVAIAQTAFYDNIKIIHLEAGLRTYDLKNPFPEEANRRIITQMTDIHLCPTQQNANNLYNENIELSTIHVVGNTVIDNLLPYKKECEYTNKVLITLHRRENHEIMNKWFEEINELAKNHPELEFIFPMHPNPNVQYYKHILTNVNVVEPLSYDDMLNMLSKVRMVLTDSGGIQEECSFLNKKCLVCRKVTERPEALGKSSFLVKTPNKLSNIFEKHINDYDINYQCPFGDGNSIKKIVDILNNIF